MPDVGVLELKIKDNSENAAEGLKELAGALSLVKTTLSGGLNLPTQAIKNFATAVSANSKALSNTGTFLNAIKEYQKVFKDANKVKFDTTPIKELKSALEGGLSVGQAGTQISKLRDAMTKDWGPVADKDGEIHSVVSGMTAIKDVANEFKTNNTASNIKAVTDALTGLTKAYKDVPSGGAHDLYGNLPVWFGDASSKKQTGRVDDISQYMEDASRRQREWFEAGGFASGKRMPLNLGQFGTKAKASGFEAVKSEIRGVTSEYKEFQETVDAANAKQEAFNNAVENVETNNFSKTTSEIEKATNNYKELSSEGTKLASTTENAKKEMQGLAAATKEAIDMTKIPAMDKGGAFGSLAEEYEHVEGLIKRAAENLDFWDKKYADTQKRIKYNGTTEELTNMLKHAEDGFSQALEAMEKSEQRLSDIKKYAAEYAETIIPESGSNANKSLEDEIKLRKEKSSLIQENIKLKKQELLEKNYPAYRDVYLSKTEGWSEAAQNIYGFTDNAFKNGKTYADALKITLEEVNKYVDDYIAATNKPAGPLLRDQIDQALGIDRAVKSAKDSLEYFIEWGDFSIDKFVSDWSHTDFIKQKIDDLKADLEGKIKLGIAENGEIDDAVMKIRRLQGEYERLIKAQKEEVSVQKEVTAEIEKSNYGWKDFSKSIRSMFPHLDRLRKRFLGMMIMRSMRYIIRQISAGFSEGIQNVYEYSKLIGGSFAPAMDSAASSLLQMKNSLGAALAPVLQTLIPYLQRAVDWFINLVNYANQFFALLRGQSTWTRAMPATTTAFKNQEKATKSAAAAMKDLLADWDELNIIQSQSGGGAGGGAAKDAEDYLSMFEEVATFDNRIKDIINFIKEHMKEIKGVATGIGAAILGWKISKGFAEVLPFLSKIGTGLGAIATIGLSIMLTDITGKEFIATGGPGWLIANALTGAVGAELAGLLASKILGTTAGTVTKGFTLFLNGLVNVKNALDAADQEEQGRAWILGALGSVEAGIGMGLGFYGLTASAGLAVGAGVITTGILLMLTASVILDKKPTAIHWGDYQATAEEIQAFVKEKVFAVSTDTILTVIDPLIEVKTEKQKELQASVNEVRLIVKKLKLGINNKEVLDDLKEKVFGNSENGTTGIIGEFRETASAMQNLIETGITLVPTVDLDENGKVKDIIDKTSEGWELLNGHMDDLGRELSAHLAEAYKEGITEEAKEMELRSITEISQMIASVSAAITQGQARERELQGLEQNLGNLSPETWGKMFDYIDEYKNNIINAYAKAYDEVTQALAGEASGLEQAMANELTLSKGVETDKYKQYKAEYEYIQEILKGRREGRQAAIDAEMNSAMNEDVVSRIHDVLVSGINYDAIRGIDVVEAFRNIGVELNSTGALEQFLDAFFNADGSVNKEASVKFEGFMDKLLESVYGDSYGIVKKAVDTGFVSMQDLLPTEIVSAIIQGFMSNTDNKEMQDALAKFLEGKFTISESSSVTQGVQEDAKDVSDVIYGKLMDAFVDGLRENTYEFDSIANELAGLYGSDLVDDVLEKVKADYDDANKSINDFNENASSSEFDGSAMLDSMREFNNGFAKEVADYKRMCLEWYEAQYMMTGIRGIPSYHDSRERHGSRPVRAYATGGFVRSGDLVMANENGNFEMMGRMGNQPVVANNNQIVSGISQGVATANSGVESRLATIEGLLNRVLQKEFVAKAVPSASWGDHGAKSAAQWDRVTG